MYRLLEGHTAPVWSVAWSPDGHFVLSGSDDKTARVWDVATGRCQCVLEGHIAPVWSVAWSPDARLVLSGSNDRTVRLWDVATGRCLLVLEGHKAEVRTVAWSADGHYVLSGDEIGELRVWKVSDFIIETELNKVAVSILPSVPDQIQFTNAKVLLVGESGVGKTGLSNYLAHDIKVEDEKPLPSTDGAWATHWPLRQERKKTGVEREIWLWDFAGAHGSSVGGSFGRSS